MLTEEIQIGAALKSLKNIKDLPRLIQEFEKAGISFIHLDFLDGYMVNEQGINAEEVSIIRRLTSLPLEAHLMEYFPRSMGFYQNLGINRVLIHHESYCNKEKMLIDAKKSGMEAGIALKPSTSHHITDILYPGLSDMVLVLATKSGSGGKVYDSETPHRIKQIANNYNGIIEVNSGVITYPHLPVKEGTTYQLSRSGATRFSLEKGLFYIGTTIQEAVQLNLTAACIK